MDETELRTNLMPVGARTERLGLGDPTDISISTRSARLPDIGEELSGRFVLRSVLGSGSYGRVYAAWDRQRARVVAIKVLIKRRAGALLHFKQEFRSLYELRHRNLVPLLKLGRDQGLWYIVMAYVEGAPFTMPGRPKTAAPSTIELAKPQIHPPETTELLTTQSVAAHRHDVTATIDTPNATTHIPEPDCDTPAPLLQADALLERMLQLADGLLALHYSGIVHCDLKPANVLVTPEEQVVILDFGVVGSTRSVAAHVRRHKAIAGTQSYMAPEFTSPHGLSPALDWYAAGRMLAVALTGRDARDLAAWPYDELARRFDHAAQERPDYRELYALAVALLHPDVDQRADSYDILRLCPPDRALRIANYARRYGSHFVGRDRELAILHQKLTSFLNHQPVTFIVAGEPGIGKTALCEAFIREVSLRPNAPWILTARCKSDELLGFRAFDEPMDGIATLMHSLDAQKLNQLLPYCSDELAGYFPTLEPFANRAKKAGIQAVHAGPLDAFRALLYRLAEYHKIMLWIEDIHQADRQSMQWIRGIFERDSQPNVFLLITERVERQTVVDDPDLSLFGYAVPLLQLKVIPQNAMRMLAKEWIPAQHQDNEALITRLVTLGQGYPNLLRTLVRNIDFILAHDDSLSLGQLLYRRIHGLQEIEFQLVMAVFCAFTPPDRRLLEYVTGYAQDAIDTALENVQRYSLVSPAQEIADEHFEISGVPVSIMVHKIIHKDQQRAFHNKYAEAAISQAHVLSPEETVHHLMRAGRGEDAIQFALANAQKADKNGEPTAAGRMYDWIIRIQQDNHAAIDPQIILKAVNYKRQAGELIQAAELLMMAADHSPAREALALRRRAAEILILCGHYRPGYEQLRLSEPRGRKLLRAFVPRPLRILVHRRRILRRLQEFTPQNTHTNALDEEIANQIAVHRIQGIDNAIGNIHAAYEHALREVDAALDTHQAGAIGWAISSLAFFESPVHPTCRHRAKNYLEVAETLAKKQQDRTLLEWIAICRSMMESHNGNYTRAYAMIRKSHAWIKQHGTQRSGIVLYMEVHHVNFAMMTGDVPGLRTLYYGLLADLRGQNNLMFETAITLAGFDIWMIDDVPESGRAAMSNFRVDYEADGFQLYEFMYALCAAELCLYEQRTKEIATHIRAQRTAERSLIGRAIKVIGHTARFMRGRLLLARAAHAGRLSARDAATLRALTRRILRSEDPFLRGAAFTLHMGHHVLQNHPGDAKTALHHALAEFETAGMTLMIAATKAAGKKMGIYHDGRGIYDELRELGVINPPRYLRNRHPYVTYTRPLDTPPSQHRLTAPRDTPTHTDLPPL